MKKCPFCAEEIQDAAIVCKHCGRDLQAKPEQPKQEKKKSQSGLVFLLLLIISCIGIYAVITSGGGGGGSGGGGNLGSISKHTVIYEVTGTTSAGSVTMQNETGGTEQVDIRVPWTKTLTLGSGDFAYLSVQNSNDGGKITCTIKVDGNDWKTSTSTTGYGIASCSGSVGR